MLCPICGAWSTVLDTRAGPHESIRRRRECANRHRFPTFETYATAAHITTMSRALASIAARRAVWQRDQAIRKDPRPRREVAAAHGIGAKQVDRIRRLAP